MAKQAALAEKLIVDGFDISGDIGSLQSISSTRQVFEMTAIDKAAHERILGKAEGVIDFMAFFNDATDQEHLTLRAPGGADRICTYLHGATAGNWAAGIVARQVNYD